MAWAPESGRVQGYLSEAVREHSRQLIPAVEQVLGGDTSAITALLVTTGPGSYAGLRVGIALAEGLALARQVPVYGIGTMEAAAAAGPIDGEWTVIHPIGRGDFALQTWRNGAALDSISVESGDSLARENLKGEGAGVLGGAEVSPLERATAAISLRQAAIATGALKPGVEAYYIREPHITRPRRAAMGAEQATTH